MNTVEEPWTMVSGGPLQTAVSPTRAAGWPLMKTFDEPVAVGPPLWRVLPSTRGALVHVAQAGGGFCGHKNILCFI
ncbi:hypothetical protein [Alkalimarinus coralli]|uniref:hypothetical protein n=1 Tax=Alkalimarinus coralli TaxID=2935863 RepID=UPI00202B46EC|nr:hypothetical protein [Alkalimarinus coralli]